jgi:hypothetical protein
MSVTLTDLQDIVKREAYPAMLDSYEGVPNHYADFCEVVDTPADGSVLGEKGTVVTGLGGFQRRNENEQYQQDQIRTAFTWYCGIHRFSKAIEFDQRSLNAIGAAGRIRNLIMELAQSGGESAMHDKNERVAKTFEAGTLTAGSLEYFDGTFQGQTDPNPKFIYDGLPWFDTAHTLAGASGTYSNHTASLALSAANLHTVRVATNSTNAVDERGRRVRVNHNALMVPPILERTARQIVESDLLPGSGNNDINYLKGKYEVIVNPYLTADAATEAGAAWWTMTKGKALVCFDSGVPTITIKPPNNEGVVKVCMDYFFGLAVKNWRHAYNANKAAS